MPKENYEKLKKRLQVCVSEEDYEDFTIYFQNYYFLCRRKYAFLGVSDEKWEALFLKSLISSLEDANILSCATAKINGVILNTLKRNLNDPRTFSNTVGGILSTFDSSKTCLRKLVEFEETLKDIGIDFNEVFYQKARRCSAFRSYLRKLGCEDFTFDEFQKLLKGFYKDYLNVKPYFFSLRECIERVDYFYGLLGIEKGEISSYEFKDVFINKVRYLLLNFDIFLKIRNLFLRIYGDQNISVFDLVFVSISYTDIQEIFENYKNYVFNGDITFLQRLNITVVDLSRQRRPEAKLSNSTFSSLSNFYEKFPLSDGIDEETRKKLVDSIIDAMNIEQKVLIKECIETGVYQGSTSKINSIIKIILGCYNRRVERYKNPVSKYDLFDLPEGFPREKRKEFVDVLFSTLTEIKNDNMNRYLNGDLELSERLFRLANSKILSLRISYNSTVDRFLNPCELHDYLLKSVDVSSSIRKEIVDDVTSGLDEEYLIPLEQYLKGLKIFLPETNANLLNKLTRLKKRCLKIFNSYIEEINSIYEILNPNAELLLKCYFSNMETVYYLGKKLKNLRMQYLSVIGNDQSQFDSFRNVTVIDILSEYDGNFEKFVNNYIDYCQNKIDELKEGKII